MKLLSVVVLALVCTSCVSHESLVNFNQEDPAAASPEDILNAINLRIQPEDLLRIQVYSFDPLAAEPFNIESESVAQLRMQGGAQIELFMGYFVDQDGYIDFPVLGRLSVVGKTLEEAKADILLRLSEYLTDPVVNIRYLNFKVTVLGEVTVPGTIRLNNKRVTILEAIGMAGDLTDYANRTNILVIREMEGVRTYERLSLQDNAIFASPYFYLQQNDVIYVEPIKARIATVADPAQRIIQYSTAALSLTSLIIALTR